MEVVYLEATPLKGLSTHLQHPMMVNFMCQLAWDMQCPDIWSDIILGVSVKVFGGGINI